MPTAEDNDALRRFLRRVWQHDITPLLNDEHAEQRARTARAGGKAAAAAGLFMDTLLRLKGRPFTRAFTVMGASWGALLPDVWSWRWLREAANARQRTVVAEQVRRRAAELADAESLELFGLSPTATHEEFRAAWREILLRWHPDKAPNEAARTEYHVRFVAYNAAHERLAQAYADGRLPASG